MDLVPYLSAVILVATIATILLAIGSYAAFKLRDKRKPKAQQGPAPVFFHFAVPATLLIWWLSGRLAALTYPTTRRPAPAPA